MGKYSTRDSENGLRSIVQVNQTIERIDFEPAASTLTGPGKPFGQRVDDFIKSARLFASQHNLESFDLKGSKRASNVDIEKAKERLGYGLPPKLVSRLTNVGEIREGGQLNSGHRAPESGARSRSKGNPGNAAYRCAMQHSTFQRQALNQ